MPREATIVEISQDLNNQVPRLLRKIRSPLVLLPMLVILPFIIYELISLMITRVFSTFDIIIIILINSLLLMHSLYASFFIDSYYTNYFIRKLQKQIKARKNSMIDFTTSKVYLVRRIPLRKWAFSPTERFTDIGFLILDFETGELQFEGERERWIIPKDAIISFHTQWFGNSDGFQFFRYRKTLMLWVQLHNEEKLLRPITAVPFLWRLWTHSQMEQAADALHHAIAHFVDPTRCPRPTDDELRPLIPPRR